MVIIGFEGLKCTPFLVIDSLSPVVLLYILKKPSPAQLIAVASLQMLLYGVRLEERSSRFLKYTVIPSSFKGYLASLNPCPEMSNGVS